jgi:hypothetical protein
MGLETYRELFAAIATTAGALTGLLFVALSVAPRRGHGPVGSSPAIRQIRAAAALLCFFNAMAVSLFALVPTTNPGYAAVTVGIGGILFTASAIRTVVTSHFPVALQVRQTGLFFILLLIFVTQVICGFGVIGNTGRAEQLQLICYALIASLLVGVSRAWELVGDRDTGIVASLTVLLGHPPDPDEVAAAYVGAGDPGFTATTTEAANGPNGPGGRGGPAGPAGPGEGQPGGTS